MLEDMRAYYLKPPNISCDDRDCLDILGSFHRGLGQ
jgi:hypothetical protein